tara:strand:- start:21458 stop:22465 length:1008 start_codon:yes stop_codon:yes gene_type:complete
MYKFSLFLFFKVVFVVFIFILMKVINKIIKKNVFSTHLYDHISLSLINSNHPRRLFLLVRSFRCIDLFLPSYLKSTDCIDRAVELECLSSDVCSDKIKKTHFIFIGDSHSEFLSRVRTNKKSHFFSNAHAIWLGPVTLFGFSSAIKIDKLLRYIKDIKIDNEVDSICIVWSLGTIDVRASIYELYLRNIVDDRNGLENLVDVSLESLNISIIRPFLNVVVSDFPNIEVKNCFLGASNSLFVGDEPRSIKNIKSIRKNNSYPTFGSVETRREFCDIVNSRIECWTIDNDYLYNNPYETTSVMSLNSAMRDGIHLTDSRMVCELALSLIDKGKSSRV